jgi:signal peptidase I
VATSQPSSRSEAQASGSAGQAGRRGADTSPEPKPRGDAVRETIESIVIAFVLAFFFRTFEAEAFVIPTGSMAPTLMGKHKDVECVKCRFRYQVGVSHIEEHDGGAEQEIAVRYTLCPQCGYVMDIAAGNVAAESYRSYQGDRILVAKFSYQLSDPRRWDVIVFHFPGHPRLPGGANTNYIKRLVGLPGETIWIRNGDIWVRGPDDDEFRIARKDDPRKLLAMLRLVHDNDYVPVVNPAAPPQEQRTVYQVGWPPRWQGDWQPEDPATCRAYRASAAEQIQWLRYHHVLPGGFRQRQADGRSLYQPDPPGMVWRQLESGELQVQPVDCLITDLNAYNEALTPTGYSASRGPPHLPEWVGDLALECTLENPQGTGIAVLELVEGGYRFRATLDYGTGEARLSIADPHGRAVAFDDPAGGGENLEPKAATPLRGPGSHHVRFANVDDELRLWIDERPIAFDAPTTYTGLNHHGPTRDDYTPAGIGARGAALRVAQLRLWRDLHYLAQGEELVGGRYTVPQNHYFALGDNSPRSLDGRSWGSVPADLMIGKALFIYWPHSWNQPLPLTPNFSRMRLVR